MIPYLLQDRNFFFDLIPLCTADLTILLETRAPITSPRMLALYFQRTVTEA